MQYRVRVWTKFGSAHVVLAKRFAPYGAAITVATIRLDEPEAEDLLADARARATALAHQVNRLERD